MLAGNPWISCRHAATPRPFRSKPSAGAFFNPNLEGAWFLSVMSVMEKITILSILLVGAAVIREREQARSSICWSCRRGRAKPPSPRYGPTAASSWWRRFSLRFVVQGALGVPIEGSMALSLVGATAYLFATTSLGILLATHVRSMPSSRCW